MPLSLVIGWFMLGFVVAAVLLHGPVAAKALLVMRREAEYAKKHGELQKKYIDSLTNASELVKENTETLKAHNQLLKDHVDLLAEFEELQRDHKALLGRAGGDVEGTA